MSATADDLSMLKAMRGRASMLLVCSTGTIALAAVASYGTENKSAYVRSDGGSFEHDGLAPGMEITVAGLPDGRNDGVAFVVRVTATHCIVDRALFDEAESPGCSIEVRMPSLVAREGRYLKPDPKPFMPWVLERFSPGPGAVQKEVGRNGQLDLRPMYSLTFHLPANTGTTVLQYTSALKDLFAIGTAIDLPNGDKLLVHDKGPMSSLTSGGDGERRVQEVAIPFWVRTRRGVAS